jgi:hypothetical protein
MNVMPGNRDSVTGKGRFHGLCTPYPIKYARIVNQKRVAVFLKRTLLQAIYQRNIILRSIALIESLLALGFSLTCA